MDAGRDCWFIGALLRGLTGKYTIHVVPCVYDAQPCPFPGPKPPRWPARQAIENRAYIQREVNTND